MTHDEQLPSHYFRTLPHSSDKLGEHHDYGFVYDLIFAQLRSQKEMLSVLEIGGSALESDTLGGSAEVWSKIPYIEKYVCVDITPVTHEFHGIFIHADAYDEDQLPKVEEHAPYDLIIDDGSHTLKDQMFFLSVYRQFLSDIGLLVCEDVYEIYRKYFAHQPDLLTIQCPKRSNQSETDVSIIVKYY